MSEWKQYKLEDVTTQIGSGATPTGGSNTYKMNGISLTRSQNVLDFRTQFHLHEFKGIADDKAITVGPIQ